MRKCLGMAGLLLALVLAAPLGAQTAGFLGSFGPQRLENRPIDTSHPLAPTPSPQAGKFNFFNLFKFRGRDFNRTMATSPVLPPSSLPSTPSKNLFQPRPPVVPNQ